MTRTLFAASLAAALAWAANASAQAAGGDHDMANMPGMDHDMAGMRHDAAPATAPAAPDHDMANMPGMGGMSMPGMNMGGHAMPYAGTLGFYPMTRDASGTAWQPDASVHAGIHGASGDWTWMVHALVNGVYDHQGGPRGADKGFAAGMVMAQARRDFEGGDTLSLRAMLSPEPLMGARGYPLLLAAGETADGRTPLVDRQHPHDLFMELSATYSHRLGLGDSLFVYAGLPGEPSFGPPTFMHRASAMDSPEAPITHHWLDSTHITFGVVTAGWVHGAWKVEASRFNGREPDQRRWDIETGALDSTAARVSWNPTRTLSLQASWAVQKSPESLEPDVDLRRWSASAIYTTGFGVHGSWSTTLAWGRRTPTHGAASDAYLAETALKPDEAWTLFARAERAETDELYAGHGHGPLAAVGKVSLGAIHDWRVAEHVKLGVGGLVSRDWVPTVLKAAYGDAPGGAMGFLRLAID